MGSRVPRVMLLITANTPQARIDAHKNLLKRQFNLQSIDQVAVRVIDAACEMPSNFAAEGIYLFADSDIASVSGSLKLARDWGTNWFVPRRDHAGRAAPLYQCRKNPSR